MELNERNYFSTEANREYMSVSQFKTFLECPARMKAELEGEWKPEPSKALLVGSYVDAYFSGTLADFVDAHPEIINSRAGGLKAEFRQANDIINRVSQDELFMRYLDGMHKQQIETGELCGHKWKIKIDAWHPDKIVDLKVMKDMEPVWKDGERKNFIDAWGYPLQGAVYQEINAQNWYRVPFYLAVVTKESEPDLAVIEIPNWKLNSEMEVVKHYIDEYAAVKEGTIEPRRCGKCPYCRRTKKLSRVLDYSELFDEMEVKA